MPFGEINKITRKAPCDLTVAILSNNLFNKCTIGLVLISFNFIHYKIDYVITLRLGIYRMGSIVSCNILVLVDRKIYLRVCANDWYNGCNYTVCNDIYFNFRF